MKQLVNKSENGQQKTGRRGKYSKNLQFTTIEEARQSLSELTLSYLNGEVSEHELRAATYAINGLTKLLVHEKLARYDARLAALEKARKT